MRSSTSIFNNPSKLSKAFNGSGSDNEQYLLARSNQFVQDVQLLSFFCIQIWGSMYLRMDIKSGKLW